MAARKRKKLFYNCIWTLILAVLLALPTLGVMDLSTLALEQETRCGQQEHTHVPECYFRDMLMCDQKAHSHSENCYLLLLEDNDINWLLSAIEDTEEKSLENVIDSAMVQALNLNPNLTSVNSQQIHLAADNIQELNTVIAENDIQPAVVLNENIRDNYLSYIPPQPEPEEEATVPSETTAATTAPSGGSGIPVPVQTAPPTTLATEPTVTTEATEPTVATTEATEPPATTEATQPPATTEATEPPAATEATQPPATTEATEPPATTEATQPPATTEATEPPATTEATQPPATTEATEPPAATEATQPPATTEATEPPATTEATQPPATTEATEPTATTEATQPPATTEATEPTATTEATEPPTTEATEPTDPTGETDPTDPTEETEPESEPLYLWQYGQEVAFMAERPAEYGELALYLYNRDHWVCVDILDMAQARQEEKTYYSVSLEQIQSTYARNLLSDGAVPGGTLYYAPQSPAMGVDNIAQVNTDTLDFGTDGSVRHVYLTDTYFNEEEQLVYQPVSFCNVTLDYTNVDPGLETEEGFVRSGTSFEAILPESYLWMPNPEEALPETDAVTGNCSLIALPLAEEEPVDLVLGTSSPVAAAAAPTLGGGPDSGNNKVHFYFLLDGQIVFLNSGDVQDPNWGGKYCSYSEAVNAYTSENPIITGLTTGNLGSQYWFYHNSSGNLTGRLTAATNFWQNLYFANTSGAQHAILSYGKGNTYSPVNFYTVKLDYSAVSGTNQVQYVEDGMNSTLSLDDNYQWYLDQAHTTPATAENLKNIRSTTTLYAAHKTRTVTFVTNGGSNLDPLVVSHGETLTLTESSEKEGYLLEGWYTDEALTKRFDFATPITENLTLYAKWALPCTVSFLDAAGSPIQESIIIAAGSELSLPQYYHWTGEDGHTFQGGETVTITADTVFTGSIYTYTVTFFQLDGSEYAVLENIPHGSVIQLPADPVSDKYTFDGWFTDETYSQEFDQTQPIAGDLELFPRWGFDVTLHYLDLEGNPKKQETDTYHSGETLTLPEHYTWKDLGNDPDDPADDKIYSGGDTLTLHSSMTLFGNPARYTVSFVNPNNTAAAEPIVLEYGGSFFFPAPPEGCVWEGSDGSHYIAEDYFDEVSSDLTFTAVEVSVTLHYNVNFPSNAVNAVDKVPTLYGTTSATATDAVPGGTSATIRSLTSNTARRQISSGNKESLTYYFKGWKLQGQDALIPPDSVLTWRQLAQYADANGNVQLTGQWEEGKQTNSVTFFVRFDSVATDTEGNIGSHPTTDYTHEIFNTYLGGVPAGASTSQLRQYEIADTTSDNSYSADQAIRALYGERPEGIWMYEFPLDNNIFAVLKDYLKNNPTKSLTVDGETVKSSELDSTHYAIRWYVFKLEGSSWHVDGKLVRREGVINIFKHFQGDDAAITQAEKGFYILAENGTRNASGVFTPYAPSHTHFKQYILTLDNTNHTALRQQYPNADIRTVTEHSVHDNYWRIRDVLLDELWQITEFVNGINGYSHYAEYSCYDSSGELTAIAEYGTQASVVGKTFALDEDPDQGLTVEFTNYYFENQSILLKKEDATTGAGIGGAGFNFIQKGNTLSFANTAPSRYSQDPDSGNQDILTGSNGYVTIDGFSYQYGADSNQGERGRILIQESVVPEGYGQAPTVELGLDENDNVFIANVTVGDVSLPQAEWSDYVELPRNDILVIKNHVTDRISVTAHKQWSTNVPADRVQVVLQANGENAANVFPGLTNVQVELNGSNGWTHTWTGLPRYAGGQPVSWGIKEVLVGNAPTLSDGISFANWIPSYSAGIPTDTDGDGKADNWAFTVTNYSKTPRLILSKIGASDEPLSGAIFTLEQVELGSGGWQRVRGSVPVSQTTGSNGQLTFDNLVGTYTYRLTEVKAPANHIILIDPVIFTIDGMGTIQKLDDTGNPVPFDSEFLKHGDKFNLTVRNLIAVEMPETGGRGIGTYWLFGMALVLTALMLYRLPARKEEGPSF